MEMVIPHVRNPHNALQRHYVQTFLCSTHPSSCNSPIRIQNTLKLKVTPDCVRPPPNFPLLQHLLSIFRPLQMSTVTSRGVSRPRYVSIPVLFHLRGNTTHAAFNLDGNSLLKRTEIHAVIIILSIPLQPSIVLKP